MFADAETFLRRGGTESDVTHDGTLNNAADGVDDLASCLMGVDPADTSTKLQCCSYSTCVTDDDLASTSQAAGSGPLVNGCGGDYGV